MAYTRPAKRRHTRANVSNVTPAPQSPQPVPYSPPPNACHIYLSGFNKICLAIPPAPGYSAGHTISIDTTDGEAFTRTLVSILAGRVASDRETEIVPSRMNTLGNPTQELISILLRDIDKAKVYRPVINDRWEDEDFAD